MTFKQNTNFSSLSSGPEEKLKKTKILMLILPCDESKNISWYDGRGKERITVGNNINVVV